MPRLTLLVGLTALIALPACGTVTRGTTEMLRIESEPVGARVRTSNGRSCDATPCDIEMPRRANFTVTVEQPGCTSRTVPVTNRLIGTDEPGGTAVLLAGGAVGLGVDTATGATQELVPNPVVVKLDC